MKYINKNNLIFGVILIVAAIFRFLYLGSIPVSIAHDEIDNIIQAQSVIFTGNDISGKWSPFDFLPTPTLMGELAPMINVFALILLPQTLFSYRFTSAFLSVVFLIILYIFLKKLKVSDNVSLSITALLVISPWHIIFSRTALEQPASLFFYVLSWIFLSNIFNSSKNKQKQILNIVAFILSYAIGFFTYHGYKFSMPIMTGLVALYFSNVLKVKNNLKVFLLIMVFMGSLYGHVLLKKEHYAQRSVEIIFSDTDRFTKSIDIERRISLAPESIKPIFSNKLLSLGQAIVDKYLFMLSPELLIEHGENNGAFALWTIGYIYLLFAPLIILGLFAIYRSKQSHEILLLALLFLSPLASVIHMNNSFAFRSGIFFVFINIIMGYGLVEFMNFVNKSFAKYRYLSFTIFGLLTVVSILHFCYLYFFVSPINNSSSYFFTERITVEYVRRNSDASILIVDSQPRYIYSGYILNKGDITKTDILSFNNQYSSTEDDTYNYHNLTVTRRCPDDISTFDTVIVGRLSLDDPTGCEAVRNLISLPSTIVSQVLSPKDSGLDRYIIGDNFCSKYELLTYIHPTSISQLSLAKLTDQQFCETWIAKQ